MKFTTEKNLHGKVNFKKSITVLVEARPTKHKVWREITGLNNVSKSSADFYLNRYFDVGQLLLLTMPLEKGLRCYDFEAEQYQTWSIIKQSTLKTIGKSDIYQMAVNFIGKEPPPSYEENPANIYKLTQQNDDGLWDVCEGNLFPSTRKQPRYMISIDAYIAVCDENENIIAHEKTVTETISAGGASVFSTLDLKIGDKVKFIKESGGFSAMAVVRNRRIGTDNLPRLHIEFIAARYPLDGIV